MKCTTFSISTETPETIDQAGYEALTYTKIDSTGDIENRNTVITLCSKIQRRAMRSKAAVFHVYLHGHTNAIDVIARSRDHNYMVPANEWPEPLMSRYVSLNAQDAADQLQSVLDEMKALGSKL